MSLLTYFRKRKVMRLWKKQKAEKWLLEGIDPKEIKRRLKEHKVSWLDRKRDRYL